MFRIFSIFFIFILVFSCKSVGNVSWDSFIPEKKKSDLVLRYFNEEYRSAMSTHDLEKLTNLLKYVDNIDILDKTKLEDKIDLTQRITMSIQQIKEKKISRAALLLKKKDIYGAILENLEVLNVEPTNSVVLDFFEKNRDDIEKTIVAILPSINKMVQDEKFDSAEKILKRLSLISKKTEITAIKKDIDKLRLEKNKKLMVDAKKSYDEKDFNKSLSLLKTLLDNDNKNNEALTLYEKTFFEVQNLKNEEKNKITKNDTKTNKTNKKEDISKTTDPIFERANTFFTQGKLKSAKMEIERYFEFTDDKKGRDLEAKILSSIRERKSKIDTILGDAILNYNSEKYDEALKQFNQVISLDADNEDASEYISRIQMRIKAFE